jgi:Cytochrome P460
MNHFIRTVAAAATLLAGPAMAADTPATVAYPEGYRQWTHVKSMVIQPGHALYEAFGGIHHLYANKKARAGYGSGKFPDGAVIVFDLLAADNSGNAVTEGPRKIVGVMEKDSKRFAATGGWGFEGFAGGDPAKRAVGNKAAEACFGCHMAQKNADYVFSTRRD